MVLMPYQSGQRSHADSCQPWRHYIARAPLVDRHHTLRMHRQTGLGGTSRHSLLCPRDATMGVDRQEEQVHQRRALFRLDARHGRNVDQQVKWKFARPKDEESDVISSRESSIFVTSARRLKLLDSYRSICYLSSTACRR